MKYILLSCIVSPFLLQAQNINSTYGSNRNNIYIDALYRMVTTIKNQDKTFKEYLDTIFVEEQPLYFLSDNAIPQKISGIPTAITEWSYLNDRYNNQKQFCLLKIYPLTLYKGKFSVFINVTRFEPMDNRPNPRFHNGIVFNYHYDTNKQIFTFTSVEYPVVVTGKNED